MSSKKKIIKSTPKKKSSKSGSRRSDAKNRKEVCDREKTCGEPTPVVPGNSLLEQLRGCSQRVWKRIKKLLGLNH
jgi:hypothetical protein